MKDEYRRLSQAQSLGFYNCCELTTVFLFLKKEKQVYHFFSIFVLEERVNFEAGTKYLTSSLIPVNNKISMGISRRMMTLSEAGECYRNLQAAVGCNVADIGEGELQIGFLEEVPPVFVQKNSTLEISLNGILKNNFKNGSYLLEFFDAQKPVCKILKQGELKRVCENLYRYVPINLFTISDRIGNFIFQFPSLNADISYHADEEEQNLNYSVRMDRRLTGIGSYQLIAELIYDDTMVGFGTMEVQAPETEMKLHVGDASRICRTTLIDPKMQLIISREETSYIRSMKMRMHMGNQFGEVREIYKEDGTVAAEVDIVYGETIRTGLPDRQQREEWIENRKYRLRMEELERRKEFLRYGIKNGPGREKAVADLRELMQRGDGHRVYLWDPYLSAKDLLDTWYYTTVFGMELRAITSRADLDKEKDKNEKGEMAEWIRTQAQILQSGSNQHGINLELRCQWGNYGYPFHDRFLMIVDETEKPQVWSLGASINSIGRKHHIIQKVLHPQMIVDSFEELWDMLSVKECLVWKSRK